MSASFTIEIEEECKACKGTGVYIGMAERDGAAVVCFKCEGTGCHKHSISYKKFEGRKLHPDVKWVYQCNPGVVVGNNDKVKFSDFGGMAYDFWKSGKEFKIGMEDRLHTCPAWYYQTCNDKLKPDWEECWSCLGRPIYTCKYFDTKDKCWERWNIEIGGPYIGED